MNTPLAVLPPISENVAASFKKKRILLVDSSSRSRDLRAEVMRKLGIDVDCAADIAEARSWWRADLYNLVLMNMDKGRGHRDRFCEDVRGAKPPQRLAFLVGEPQYLSDSPNADEELLADNLDERFLMSDLKAALSIDLKDLNQRWGILEASRRISAVRSACSARTQAMRDRPAPPRDPEGHLSKRTAATLDDLLREEMQ
jgi:DNA-binding NtrC family response regulator